MKKAQGFFVCFIILIAWHVMGVALFGWKHGGGAIPTLILFTILFKVYRHFTEEPNLSKSNESKLCQKCRYELSPNENFCRNCGTKTENP